MSEPRVSPRFDLLAAYAWRLVVIAAVVALVLWVTGRLLLVVVPLALAALLARALWPLNSQLRRRLRPALASLVSLLVLLVVLGTALGLAGVALAGEFDQLAPTVEQGVDDVTDWLVDDSPFNVSREDVEELRADSRDAVSEFLRSGGSGIATGAVVAAEMLAGAVLALIIAFFVLKDARGWALGLVDRLDHGRRDVAGRCLRRAWDALGGYLRGVVALGTIEAIAIGTAMFVVGSNLIAPVMLLTFLAAFVPIVGAVFAGIVAVLVVLVTGGTTPALIVAAVAIIVQQLDNDLLAPVVYGRALRLHPLVVLLGIAAGGALFGFIGTFFAVPFLAVTINTIDEWRSAMADRRAALADADTPTAGAGSSALGSPGAGSADASF